MRRTLRPLATLALVALISLAGCSDPPAGTGTGSGGDNTAATQNAPAETGTSSSDANRTAAAHDSSPSPTPATPASQGSSGGNNTAANREQAVRFAQCMRANGISAFPDPNASGELTIDQIANGSSLDPSSAAFKKAIGACKDLEPPGFTGRKRSPEQQEAALKFAQCVRNNGVKDFPDPDPNGPLIDTSRIPSAAGRGARSIPGFQAALAKCRDFAVGAGVTGQ